MLPARAFALSNVDDRYGRQILEGTRARKFLYGFKENDDFFGEIKKIDFNGLDLVFNNTNIHSMLLGRFNANNLLSVWGACKLLEFDMTAVKKIIEQIEPPQGRFEHFLSPNGVLIIVDYAHSPDSLEKILLAIKELKSGQGKIISVFGCGGDRDPMKRKIMGHIGARLSDIAIFTSDNPRSEDPEKIIEQMKEGLSDLDLKKVITIADRRLAIMESVKLAKKSDIILCAGKGHEDYQEINGVKIHFDDVEEFKRIFTQK
jgi:UDP-N-acetylmuramoyl-L-alanyl-D-glutamate--2,6-diaminopimelate ligase